MGKWILIPDSFKGTMSSREVCTMMASALRHHLPEAEIVSVPVADGGEGSVEAFLTALGGWRFPVQAPTGDQSPAFTAACRMGPRWWRWPPPPDFR